MPRHYNHAPIVEAIIDLKGSLLPAVGMDALSTYAAALKARFPVSKPIAMVTMGFEQLAADKSQFHTDQSQVGLRLETADSSRVLQIQRSGFTYSHLAPYSDWITFRDEAKELWSRYLEATRVDRVTRLAVRVINKLAINGPVSMLPKYVNLRIQTPDGIPAFPDRFFAQLHIDGARWAEGCRVLVNAGAVPQVDAKLEVLLDFDIFVETTKPAGSFEIWEILDKLSVAKDDLFEACITDDTRELIK